MSRTEKTPLSFLRRSTLEGLILVIVAALTLEATSLVQYFFGMKGLREEAALRADRTRCKGPLCGPLLRINDQ